MQRSSAWMCVDCYRSTRKLLEYYMVADPVWAQAGSPNMLCIGCLERRLGRPLTQSDMLNAPVNQTPHMPRSERLTRILGNMIMTPEQWATRPPQLRARRQKGFGRLDLQGAVMVPQIIPFMEECPTPGDIVLTYTAGDVAD